MSSGKAPDFVCIGAQKAGTTWLYENLVKRPDVWMPPIKEIHYFNRVCVNEALLGQWNIPHPHGVQRYMKAIKKIDIKMLRWLLRYYELGMEASWYFNLFKEEYTQGKICGDITPAYSTLDERGIRYASQVLTKETPIILMLRNPIERGWSAVKMMLRRDNICADEVSEEKLLALLSMPNIRLGSQYSEIIMLWKKYFNNVQILFFDELCESPKELLLKVSDFLGITENWDESIIKKRVWADEKKLPIPEHIMQVLKLYYADGINRLSKMDDCERAGNWRVE